MPADSIVISGEIRSGTHSRCGSGPGGCRLRRQHSAGKGDLLEGPVALAYVPHAVVANWGKGASICSISALDCRAQPRLPAGAGQFFTTARAMIESSYQRWAHLRQSSPASNKGGLEISFLGSFSSTSLNLIPTYPFNLLEELFTSRVPPRHTQLRVTKIRKPALATICFVKQSLPSIHDTNSYSLRSLLSALSTSVNKSRPSYPQHVQLCAHTSIKTKNNQAICPPKSLYNKYE